MSHKVLVILGTAEKGKAEAGAMFAVNALKNEWLDDVKLLFFGPAEQLVLEDPDIQELVRQYHRQGGTAVACRFLAARAGIETDLSDLGLEVEYVGPLIADLIKDGYTPMVW